MSLSPVSNCLIVMLAVLLLGAGAGADLPPAEAEPQSDAQRDEALEQDPDADSVDARSIGDAFAELGHSDAEVREAARVRLMGMGQNQLETFQQIVEASRPLMPSQAAVLRPIVEQVYLAGEPFETLGTEGFLGVRMQDVLVTTPEPGDEAAVLHRSPVGVVIVERMPGFAGARVLLDGDVVLNIVERPVPVLRLMEFSTIVRETEPGTTIHFELLRHGQVIRVPVTPGPRPIAADPEFGNMQELLNQRRDKFHAYWERNFKHMLDERVG